MALIVETGAVVAGADSYIDLEDAQTYIETYLPSAAGDWPAADADQEVALRIGCQALEATYGARWLSSRLNAASSLTWPRYSFYDRTGKYYASDAIPEAVRQAQVEMALLYAQGEDVFPQEAAQNVVLGERTKVGDIETEKTYGRSVRFSSFRKADLLLASLLRSTTNVNLIR